MGAHKGRSQAGALGTANTQKWLRGRPCSRNTTGNINAIKEMGRKEPSCSPSTAL